MLPVTKAFLWHVEVINCVCRYTWVSKRYNAEQCVLIQQPYIFQRKELKTSPNLLFLFFATPDIWRFIGTACLGFTEPPFPDSLTDRSLSIVWSALLEVVSEANSSGALIRMKDKVRALGLVDRASSVLVHSRSYLNETLGSENLLL